MLVDLADLLDDLRAGGQLGEAHDRVVSVHERLLREIAGRAAGPAEPIGHVAINVYPREFNDPSYLFYVDEDDAREMAGAFSSRYEIRPVYGFVFEPGGQKRGGRV